MEGSGGEAVQLLILVAPLESGIRHCGRWPLWDRSSRVEARSAAIVSSLWFWVRKSNASAGAGLIRQTLVVVIGRD